MSETKVIPENDSSNYKKQSQEEYGSSTRSFGLVVLGRATSSLVPGAPLLASLTLNSVSALEHRVSSANIPELFLICTHPNSEQYLDLADTEYIVVLLLVPH